MKKVELESFIKSFSLFFTSISILIAVIYFISHTKEIQKLDDKIFSEMRICSFNLECEKYKIDFVSSEGRELYRLYKKSETITSYFPIPNSTKNFLEFSYSDSKYKEDLAQLVNESLASFFLSLIVVLILSVFFSLYTLYPLRNALRLTREFGKDILHDFNTPLSTLRLNIAMLSQEDQGNKKILRMEKSIQNILNLQANLRAYLDENSLDMQKMELGELIEQRVEVAKMSYEKIKFYNRVKDVIVYSNKDALIRILDNILNNGAKYNKKDGRVDIYIDDEERVLSIQDSGRGITHPERVFDRFYKEHERGIGIGLHIVKKLCNELGMKVWVESTKESGSTFYLKIK
ncbi:MAG: HAMP domain-containing sensor histidine kinase [Campylobacterota bacterium]|nr:HAMP domain-containing sensor histidine kinase [Campylobacterota bacterium]